MSEDVQVGQLRKLADGSFEGHLKHFYEGHTRAEVWHALTDAAEVAKWIAPGTIDARKGGRIYIDFKDSGTVIDSEVLACEPQKVFSYSWGRPQDPQRPLRWELRDAAGGTELLLTVKTPAGEDAARACAGFEGHMEMLAGVLEGVPIQFPFDLFVSARKAYNAQIGK